MNSFFDCREFNHGMCVFNMDFHGYCKARRLPIRFSVPLWSRIDRDFKFAFLVSRFVAKLS